MERIEDGPGKCVSGEVGQEESGNWRQRETERQRKEGGQKAIQFMALAICRLPYSGGQAGGRAGDYRLVCEVARLSVWVFCPPLSSCEQCVPMRNIECLIV